ncbi:hypothetical protein ISS05_03030 [Candidatus Woesearchaeota archaeon]|nr:hypothetical protein [Candidatus Woesearchaeota archaeon]
MDIDEFLDRETMHDEKDSSVKKNIGAKKNFVEKEPYKDLNIFYEISEHIKKNQLVEAENLYSRVWSKINDEKLTWNENLCHTLIEINKELENAVNNLYPEIREKITTIHSLMVRVTDSLKKGKNESAVTAYSEIMDIYSGIPDIFLADKRKIHRQILLLYREVRNNLDKEFFQDFNSRISQINSLIYSAKLELQKNNLQGAINHYAGSLNLYDLLPNGFFMYRLQLSNKILELYKEITVSLEIIRLRSGLSIQQETQPLKRTNSMQKSSKEKKPHEQTYGKEKHPR